MSYTETRIAALGRILKIHASFTAEVIDVNKIRVGDKDSVLLLERVLAMLSLLSGAFPELVEVHDRLRRLIPEYTRSVRL